MRETPQPTRGHQACIGPGCGDRFARRVGAVGVVGIVHDQKRVLPCAALLKGEYGLDGLFMGVPCRLGSAGLEEVIQIDLSAEERAELERSASAVRELIAVMGL